MVPVFNFGAIRGTKSIKVGSKEELASPEPAWYDEYGNQIPPEWVEELREAGLPMFTYEEMMQRRKQQYLDEARARREAAKRATQPAGQGRSLK